MSILWINGYYWCNKIDRCLDTYCTSQLLLHLRGLRFSFCLHPNAWLEPLEFKVFAAKSLQVIHHSCPCTLWEGSSWKSVAAAVSWFGFCIFIFKWSWFLSVYTHPLAFRLRAFFFRRLLGLLVPLCSRCFFGFFSIPIALQFAIFSLDTPTNVFVKIQFSLHSARRLNAFPKSSFSWRRWRLLRVMFRQSHLL